MSRETESKLARRANGGDNQAARAIIRANLRHVVAIAMKYKGYHVPLDDLISQGNLGMLHAMRKFDPSRGKRFVTYAAHWVRAYMLQHIMTTSAMVGGGTFRSAYFFSYGRSREEALRRTEGDTDAALRLLADKYNKSIEAIRRLDGILGHRDASLDTPAYEGDATPMIECLPSDDPSPFELLEEKSTEVGMSTDVWRAICRLDEREQTIVMERLMADRPLTLQELGNRFGCSRERVRQLEMRAKRKLREVLG